MRKKLKKLNWLNVIELIEFIIYTRLAIFFLFGSYIMNGLSFIAFFLCLFFWFYLLLDIARKLKKSPSPKR